MVSSVVMLCKVYIWIEWEILIGLLFFCYKLENDEDLE